MKQAGKTLFFFAVLALAIYYIPLFFKEAPLFIVRSLKSSQMANLLMFLNQKTGATLYFNK